jgi:hypothetical protein
MNITMGMGSTTTMVTTMMSTITITQSMRIITITINTPTMPSQCQAVGPFWRATACIVLAMAS